MLKIDYNNQSIRVDAEMVSKIFDTPLTMSVVFHINKMEIWSCNIDDYVWSTFPTNEMRDVRIYDVNGNLIMNRVWDVLIDGDIIYKTLYFYCLQLIKKQIRPNGLAIGVYDGTYGEWVPVILNNISDGILVEASNPQYKRLYQNFISNKNISFINDLVTTDGNPIEFFEGGEGFYNTIIRRVIEQREPDPVITAFSFPRQSSIRESISINNIIQKMNRFDWLYLDVNGYESSLISSIDLEILPPLIIFRHNHLLSHEKLNINTYLINNGYYLKEDLTSTLGIKNHE